MAVTRLLIVAGEVMHENHIECVKSDISAGLSTVPSDIIQLILADLQSLPAQSVAGSLDAGILLERASPNLTLRFACKPSNAEFASLFADLLASPVEHREVFNAVLVYGGLLGHGTGHWILSDFVFTPTSFVHQLELLIQSWSKTIGADNERLPGSVHIHVAVGGVSSGGEWRQLLFHHFELFDGRTVQITVNTFNAQGKPIHNHPAADLAKRFAFDEIVQAMWMELADIYGARLDKPLAIRNPTEPSLRVLRFSLYIFPEGSGQSSILTLPGYAMLVNAGHSRHPNCWPVLSFLERLDAVLITHWAVDSVLGMLSLLPYAFASTSPSAASDDNVLCLLAPPPFPPHVVISSDPSTVGSPLSLNIPHLVSKLLTDLKQAGVALNLHALSRGAKIESPPRPIRLYQKVGQGTLEAHVLTPGDDDTTELRNLVDSWLKMSSSLTSAFVSLGKTMQTSKIFVPLLSYASVSVLIVWRPTRETESILRILFISPNAHQTRILLSLEAIVATYVYLRHQNPSLPDFDRKPLHQKRTDISNTKRPTIGTRKSHTTTRTVYSQRPPNAAFGPGCTEASNYAVTNIGTMLPPYDKIKPLYVDVSFLPGGGNPYLVDIEWFKRVRARFYVVTDPDPSVNLLESMVCGKETWDGQDSKLRSSIIFARESEKLLLWIGKNTARLNACNMDVAAIASRSRIQLVREQGPTTMQPVSDEAFSCVGYRIDL